MSMELGPYSNFHELNQDWFLSEFNKVIAQWLEMQKDFENITKDFNLLNDKFKELKNYVIDYFKNLDVQEEINNKLDEVIASGRLDILLTTFIPYVTPEMFGAKGNGTTDDTIAIQRAINTGKTVIFSNEKIYGIDVHSGEPFGSGGAYEVALRLHENTLDLNGSTIKMITHSTTGQYYGILIDGDNACIKNGVLIGDKDLYINNPTDTNGHMIATRNSSSEKSFKNVKIENCEVCNAWGDGIIITGYFPIENVEISNNYVHNCRREGIFVENAKNIRIDNNLIENIHGSSTESGIGIEPFNAFHSIENAFVFNNKILDCGVNGLYLYVDPYCYKCKNVSFKNNFIDTGNYGVSVFFSPYIKNEDITNTPNSRAKNDCTVTIEDNTIVKGNQSAIVVYNGEESNYITGNNNTIINDTESSLGNAINFQTTTQYGTALTEEYSKRYNIKIENTIVTGTGTLSFFGVTKIGKVEQKFINCIASIVTNILNTSENLQVADPYESFKITSNKKLEFELTEQRKDVAFPSNDNIVITCKGNNSSYFYWRGVFYYDKLTIKNDKNSTANLITGVPTGYKLYNQDGTEATSITLKPGEGFTVIFNAQTNCNTIIYKYH